MADNHFTIATTTQMESADVLRQLAAISSFPCTIQMLGRVFPIASKDELWSLRQGFEMGCDFTLNQKL